MRGQIWPDTLILVSAVVLGILLAFGSVFDTIKGAADVVRKTPYILVAEANIEQNIMRPVFLVRLYYDGNTHLDALDDTNVLIERLSNMGVEVSP